MSGEQVVVVALSEYAQIAREIVRRMETGEYPPGSRLPAGGELADEFGVTRQTINTAVKELVMQGLVRIERGRGTYAADPPEVVAPEDLVDYALGRQRVGDVMLFRNPDGLVDRVVLGGNG